MSVPALETSLGPDILCDFMMGGGAAHVTRRFHSLRLRECVICVDLCTVVTSRWTEAAQEFIVTLVDRGRNPKKRCI